ncbi:UTP--glucose-1-phosphate uridylyltransferase [Glycomyces sp. TRM65418]|uniref:UTP--glucose-1-phosphate uridylyltransferase n=1 Tax=Glycomyces sp. TRM65418 TaxID=2867006 RepID=UPI001CE4CD49|nr:UTP--glucose-1-phosphate uridylyltransferase [Glycomyces sp. TRM65418]MCC3763670.1 UTP--glucose-1-phosphate uridylyltransferase [Glycomyces sp. TRM65418]QZD57652.1 UTP--glucose-1-phosphate uridylyltransferase [Glycomyces sp. TRM65418]
MSDTAPRATKAVIPAAGFATRFLPVTKAIPKELLPIVDKPVLQYIVEEAAAAGLEDVTLVTAPGKDAMVDYFDARADLDNALKAKGKDEMLARVKAPESIAEITAIRQGGAKGLGHAVGRAASHVGDEPFAVLLGDEFYEPDLLPRMIDLQAETGGIVLALLEVPREEVVRYGVAAVETTDDEDVVRVTGLVEKPAVDDAPSNLILIGRYVLPGTIFPVIDQTPPGRGDEIQLTDAMDTLRDKGTPVHAVVYRGRRYDTGEPVAYLQTLVELASRRDDLPGFNAWLREFSATLD